ncbi:HupE/UreJ family protein [Pelagibacterium sp. H642]|uniref:HupE/UreJ family protein n=1 Tax=Pelagibacterium sp. H642 TaxID=1881069 RepID=UPI002814C9FA|nr:HupE/UreJ family protein [Pelagibacterium sp. H642]WMT91031.1 HupE/UreJ family protein [Pelagibacterium sp. H642]
MSSRNRKKVTALLAGLCALAPATPALAHHALGGSLPMRFETGLLSGLAHPIINFDHFAFVAAVGVFAAVTQASKLLPLWFVLGTVAGCLFTVAGLVIPLDVWLVHGALLALGLALALGKPRMPVFDTAAFAVAGMLHGSVYAEAIVGTVSSSLGGYLVGFTIIQMLVASGAMFAAYALWCGDRLYASARIIGGVVAGVGLTVLIQTGVSALFPALA